VSGFAVHYELPDGRQTDGAELTAEEWPEVRQVVVSVNVVVGAESAGTQARVEVGS
jgi:hypothetical protein